MLEIQLLGQFKVLREGLILNLPTRKCQVLFAYLLLNPNQTHRREKLAGLLWPDSDEATARSNLRHELWRLRKVLDTGGESYFQVDDLTIAFNPQSNYSLDVDQLNQLAAKQASVPELMHALASYRGKLLPGFYEDWVLVERDRLDGIFEAKISHLLEILQQEGRWEEAIDWANRWISSGDKPEAAYRTLMNGFAYQGDVAKAITTYERFARTLQKDIGIPPSVQTQDLYKQLKTRARKNNYNRDDDLEDQHPGFASQPTTSRSGLPKIRRTNLPAPLTSFIGREKEVKQVQHLVASTRLVTITGSGGMGKTRLAIQVASELVPLFKDGVWWVELAPLLSSNPTPGRGIPTHPDSLSSHLFSADVRVHAQTSMKLVAQAVSNALRIQESPDAMVMDSVHEYLFDKELLLVLDNCEHLIEECAALVEDLLGNCAHLTILSTSREALGVPGEVAWRLPSLSLPKEGTQTGVHRGAQSEAVYLFIERAGDLVPGYEPNERDVAAIDQICLRLDGIPLAIELAAARMNVLSAQEIADRLDNRFSLLSVGRRTALPRHQTLQAAIEWSYDLLSTQEQRLYRRLAVFPGSFSLDAAEAICAGDDLRGDEVLPLLGRLVDKSLLNLEPRPHLSDLATRYRFLDTIRTFGRMKLSESNEDYHIRNQHAAYYVRLVGSAESELLHQNQLTWYRLLMAESENLRAVVDWAVESDQAEIALRLVASLNWFWYIHGSLHEGCDLVIKAVEIPSASQFIGAKIRALNTAGYLHCIAGNTTYARKVLEEAMDLLRGSDDFSSLAWTKQFLGLVAAFEGDYDRSDILFEEGLELVRQHKDVLTNNFLFFVGDVGLLKGDSSRAKKIYIESAQIFRKNDNKSFLAYPVRRLGYLGLEKGDLHFAQGYFQESYRLNREVEDKPGLTASLVSLAHLAIYAGRTIEACKLYGLVESRLETLGIKLLYLDQAELNRLSGKLRATLDNKTFSAAFAEGWQFSEEQMQDLVGKILRQSPGR